MTTITLTVEEANAVIRKTYDNHKVAGEDFDKLAPDLQLKAMIGAIGIVDALQQMGYRITRPLKAV